MAFIPTTNINLVNVPLKNDYENTLKFTSQNTQYNYFNGLSPKRTFTQCNYVKDNINSSNQMKILLNIPYDLALSYNYIFYQNSNYQTKWFYGFITNWEYSGSGTTYCTFEIDVLQTFQFDITYYPTFVEKMHEPTDNIGDNIVPENFSVDDYNFIEDGNANYNSDFCSILVLSTYQDDPYPDYVLSATQTERDNGIPQTLNYIYYDTTTATGAGALRDIFASLVSANKKEAIVETYLCPKELIAPSDRVNGQTITTRPNTITRSAQVPETVSGYLPKNNKLLTYPYSYLYITNFEGGVGEYRYEDFATNNLNFTFYGDYHYPPRQYISPRVYKNGTGGTGNQNISQEFSFPLSNFPTFPYTISQSADWFAKNAISYPLSILSATIGVTAGIASGGIGLLVGASSAISLAEKLGQGYVATSQPAVARGSFTQGYGLAYNGFKKVAFMHAQLKRYRAIEIDDYWSLNGYEQLKIMDINITSRPNWNYIKTQNMQISLSIGSQKYKNQIEDIYNKGVRYWHNPNTFLDYTQNNSPI